MVIALKLLHPVLAGLMLAAVISAILSTVSSQLLVAASAVSYDVVEGAFGRVPTTAAACVSAAGPSPIVGVCSASWSR